jgi:hypothetical protein
LRGQLTMRQRTVHDFQSSGPKCQTAIAAAPFA